jgi:hypothetical protein
MDGGDPTLLKDDDDNIDGLVDKVDIAVAITTGGNDDDMDGKGGGDATCGLVYQVNIK